MMWAIKEEGIEGYYTTSMTSPLGRVYTTVLLFETEYAAEKFIAESFDSLHAFHEIVPVTITVKKEE